VAAFRLTRHHLLFPAGSDPVAACRAVCGIQAQLMPAAHLNIAARTRGLSPARINAALWQERTLVKCLCMRQTVHLLRAADFPVYMAAIRRSRVAAVERIMARFQITARDREELLEAILEALEAGPVPNRELAARVRPRVSHRVRAWMARVWNPHRLALAEGLICYGPDEGQQVSFARVDCWLPAARTIAESDAQRRLLADFMGSYGPATPQDFSKWSGIPVAEARRAWEASQDDLAEVTVSGRPAWLLRKDLKTLRSSTLEGPAVNLLGAFDSYLLAHAKKDHLIEPRHYKRVYRSLGWISPVVLVEGRVAGTWQRSAGGGSNLVVSAEMFAKPSASICERIEVQAAHQGEFLGRRVEVKFLRA
jgi:uncharacterized protein YcaQ